MQEFDHLTRRITRELARIDQAKAEVQPFVGAIDSVCVSVGDVYRAALDRMGHDTTELAQHNSNAAKAAFEIAKHRRRPKTRLGMDADATARRREMFPNANRLGR